ncbi:DNA-binding response regulator [Vibrio sp. 10N.286.49.B3]|uniref:response regulator transcription factor n=1 Tax=Vibrio sp. 10N.286.49.B3 TaxID=1880855 RepID=UPI000C8195F4|nr:response regulator transcription factor [Vibrio sp. 10N.286.49.B3]PMH40857.1 DNA-binding response regulator [Vibrio sp. 10N.286.49.B3]
MLNQERVESQNILIVEDDNDIADLVEMHLGFQGHYVKRSQSLEEADSAISAQIFDLIILDRGLPDGDGVNFTQQLRQQANTTPILMLTARDSEKDKVEGLESGVDDYLTKPFGVLEFQARVRTILRRHIQLKHLSPASLTESEPAPLPSNESNELSYGPLSICPILHKVSINHTTISLTAMEFSLLHFLAKRPGRVYSKDELLEHVWDTQCEGYHHTVCSTINRLRTKLALSHRNEQYIHTVWGVGYKFEAIPSS